MKETIFQDFSKKSRCEVRFHVPLREWTAIRIGGEADVLFRPARVEDAVTLLELLSEAGVPFFPMGNGTNLLAEDAGFRDVLIDFSDCRGVHQNGARITAKAGTPLRVLCNFALVNGFGGFEGLAGIPGTVGGALYSNAGAFGTEISDYLKCVTVWNAARCRREILYPAQLCFGHRTSVFQTRPEYTVLSAVFCFPEKTGQERARMAEFSALRKATQPCGKPNAGSIFRKAGETPAGALLDALGAKGWRVGGAAVSEKHANFIVNTGGATAADVLALIDRMRAAAYAASGVFLVPEVVHLQSHCREGFPKRRKNVLSDGSPGRIVSSSHAEKLL